MLFSEESQWKLTTGNFHSREYPLAMKPSLSLSAHLPPFLLFFPMLFPFLFYFASDCVPLIKCCSVQREGFYLFKIFFLMPVGSGAYHMTS